MTTNTTATMKISRSQMDTLSAEMRNSMIDRMCASAVRTIVNNLIAAGMVKQDLRAFDDDNILLTVSLDLPETAIARHYQLLLSGTPDPNLSRVRSPIIVKNPKDSSESLQYDLDIIEFDGKGMKIWKQNQK